MPLMERGGAIPPGSRHARRVALGVALLQIALIVGSFSFAFANQARAPRTDVTASHAYFSAVLLVYVLVGVAIVARRPRHPVGWMFCIAPLAFQATSFLEGYARFGLVVDPGSLPLAREAAWLATFLWAPGSTVLLVLVPLLFPDGKLASRAWRPLFILAIVASSTIVVCKAVYLWPVRGAVVIDPTFVDRLPPGAPMLAHAVLQAAVESYVPLGIGTAVALLVRYRRGHGVERAQLKWFFAATAVVPVALVLDPGPLFDLLRAVAFTLIPIATAIAITRYRLYEIDHLLNRSLVYGLVTTVGVAVYLGVVAGAQLLIPAANRSPLVVAVSTLAAAALFRPLRDRVQRGVDRQFNRAHYDAERIVDDYRDRLRTEVELSTVHAELLDAVRQTVQPASAGIWLAPKVGA